MYVYVYVCTMYVCMYVWICMHICICYVSVFRKQYSYKWVKNLVPKRCLNLVFATIRIRFLPPLAFLCAYVFVYLLVHVPIQISADTLSHVVYTNSRVFFFSNEIWIMFQSNI